VARTSTPALRRPAKICLVSREVYPLTGGGIGSYVTALAGLLRELGEVHVITSDLYEEEARRLLRAGDPRLPGDLRWTFVPEPRMEETGDWFGFHHCWSARVLEALEEEYGSEGPHLIEFPDYHAEGFATIQAKRAGHRTVRDSQVVLRAHTSFEMCRVLDGWVGSGEEEQSIVALERWALKYADALLWAGGDVLGTYQRFYGAGELAPGVRIRHPLAFRPPAEVDEADFEAHAPLKVLYVGRLERRKGVRDLVRALLTNDSDGWHLTLVGGDTETGPLGTSQRAQLEMMTRGDHRVSFVDAVPRHELFQLIRDHHVLAMPSRWECWPTVVLEAMALNRPVIGTPTGGMVEMIRPAAGWLTEDVGAAALTRGLDALIGDLSRVTEAVRARGPRAAADDLAGDEGVRSGYDRLLGRPATARRGVRRGAAPPLVSVVVPYFDAGAFLRDTLDSIESQTYRHVEAIVVNDGSRAGGDAAVLGEAEARPAVRVFSQPNRGLGGARMAGIGQSRGRYVLPLDADNVIAPTFIERCVELLETDPGLAYVTSWSRFIDEKGEPQSHLGSGLPRGYHPIGNETPLVEERNTAGDALAVLPRRLFDLGFSYSSEVPIAEDWMLYRALHRAGRYGLVIPERLIGYRVRSGSMYQASLDLLPRVREEATTQLDTEAIAWVR
jgi:glycogen synthase